MSACKNESMRPLSLLSLIAALVMVGFVLKRQLSVTHKISAPVGNTIPTRGDAVPPAPGNNPGAPMSNQVRDALDQAAHQRQQRLRELESAGSGRAQ